MPIKRFSGDQYLHKKTQIRRNRFDRPRSPAVSVSILPATCIFVIWLLVQNHPLRCCAFGTGHSNCTPEYLAGISLGFLPKFNPYKIHHRKDRLKQDRGIETYSLIYFLVKYGTLQELTKTVSTA